MRTLKVLTEDGSTPTLGRFLLYEVESFEDLRSLPALSEHFALFTAFDLSEVTGDEMLATARLLLHKGLAYASCWGEGCERWHDALDEERTVIDVEESEEDFEEDHPPNVVMTTWHDDEPLTDALMFFGRMAVPTPRYAVNCNDYVIAATSNYVDVIRYAFRRSSV